ncbi:MAG: hypothetical protein KGQ59_07525, partial [Bdellovibrionales bacterium]|nr:hypothetical protein [Bdellovibrionales bacterium]
TNGVSFGSGFACRLSNGNFFLRYTGYLSGRIDAVIRVSTQLPNGELGYSAQEVFQLSNRELVIGMGPKNCSPILSSGRFAGWYCPEPSQAERALFEGRHSTGVSFEIAFVNQDGLWDSRYSENYRFSW